jgi:FlaG/FlaF family flagellin (archaellin)
MSEYSIDDGVSPVVGVVVMVAVTVVIAVVIGAFVLDLGDDQQENVNAGVSMDETGSGFEVRWIDKGNADKLEVLVDGEKVSGANLTSVGDSVTVTAGADDTVSVRGVSTDTEVVLISDVAENDTTGGSDPSVVSGGSNGTTTNSLSGVVSYNPPAEGVTVELLDSSGTVVDSDTTAKDGSYKLEDDGTGSEIQVNGYGSYSKDVGDIYLGALASNTGESLPSILMDGDGSSSNPYKADSASDLYSVREDLDAEYKLVGDVTGSSTSSWNGGDGFTSIGDSSTPFTGVIDGNGYTVSGLYNHNRSSDAGLVSKNEGVIKNITLSGVSYEVGSSSGVIAGTNTGTISNVSVDGSIQGIGKVGGVAGVNTGTIKDSVIGVDVSAGGNTVGGVVGVNGDGTTTSTSRIDNVSYNGSVSGFETVGGIVGSSNTSEITNSTFESSGSVSGDSELGGIYASGSPSTSGNTNNGSVSTI